MRRDRAQERTGGLLNIKGPWYMQIRLTVSAPHSFMHEKARIMHAHADWARRRPPDARYN